MADVGAQCARATARGMIVTIVLAAGGSVSASDPGTESLELPDWAIQPGPGVANHPVDVVPSESIRVPPDWPLSVSGTLTCLTCHVERPGPGSPQLRRIDYSQLEAGRFCSACHTRDDSLKATSMHWRTVQVAHLTARGHRSRGTTLPLDGISRDCLACHDGVSAMEPAHATQWSRGPGSIGDPRRSHPVGVVYPTRSSRNSSVPFPPASLLPKTIRLPGGVVSCVSCHNLYARDRFRLAVPMRRSELCMTCHELD